MARNPKERAKSVHKARRNAKHQDYIQNRRLNDKPTANERRAALRTEVDFDSFRRAKEEGKDVSWKVGFPKLIRPETV